MAGDRKIEIEGRMVWTKKSTTSIFHPFTRGLRAGGISDVRPALLELVALMSDVEVAIGYQIANEDDEDDWGGTTMLSSSFTSTSGMNHEASWTDLSSSLTKRLVRFGFLVRNKTGTTLEIAQLAARIDIREL